VFETISEHLGEMKDAQNRLHEVTEVLSEGLCESFGHKQLLVGSVQRQHMYSASTPRQLAICWQQ
jgi:hypothetical protein